MPPRLFRRGPVVIFIFGTSAFGGAAYRFFKPSESLHPHDFTPYTLIDKQRVSSTSAIFTLRHSHNIATSSSLREVWKRSIWSLQIKQPQLQIARAYTPLPPEPHINAEDGEDDQVEDIRLLIRQEQGGEMSTYLHRLPEMSTIELRGPHVECEIPEDVTDVVFLAGGTGIAPAMQVAQVLGRRSGSRMSLLWANRRREECVGGVGDVVSSTTNGAQSRRGWRNLFGLIGQSAVPPPSPTSQSPPPLSNIPTKEKGLIVQELEALQAKAQTSSKANLQVQYFVDEENTFIQPSDVATRLQTSNSTDPSSHRKLIFVSGPEGFIDYWAGKKVWSGGREVQGPLGGALSRMDIAGWKVVKL
ncbi:hypothetical protein DM02DRAFT_586928 [Periconia macrospinosa]|uniref:FAD-binding FR-type domain-containing protein n=1 Tax=Periconia macrospinosa TaxID=97972 RepID=A0A2V1E0N7_9PLEO|nr:hypothetical protein DM02DRAFT_586928 [Periconia macrospinosa]